MDVVMFFCGKIVKTQPWEFEEYALLIFHLLFRSMTWIHRYFSDDLPGFKIASLNEESKVDFTLTFVSGHIANQSKNHICKSGFWIGIALKVSTGHWEIKHLLPLKLLKWIRSELNPSPVVFFFSPLFFFWLEYVHSYYNWRCHHGSR